jgi:hypothetical protein
MTTNVADKRRNPSNYAMVVISEGASMLGGQVVEFGQEDAYGHKKLGGIGQITGEALKQLTGIDIVHQQIAYLMRAGVPDSLLALLTAAAWGATDFVGGVASRAAGVLAHALEGVEVVHVVALHEDPLRALDERSALSWRPDQQIFARIGLATSGGSESPSAGNTK